MYNIYIVLKNVLNSVDHCCTIIGCLQCHADTLIFMGCVKKKAMALSPSLHKKTYKWTPYIGFYNAINHQEIGIYTFSDFGIGHLGFHQIFFRFH